VPATSGSAHPAGVPRLLPGGDWEVTRVDEWQAGSGEMTFARADGRELELSWGPTAEMKVGGAEQRESYELAFGTADGFQAEVRKVPGDGYTADWVDGDTTVVARGEAESAAAFAGLVQSLHEVGFDEWRRALPPSAVTPAERLDAVEEMLAGLPLPPGLDTEALRSGSTTRDRYQLSAQVAGAVVCGWIGAWADAKADGDERGMARAADALATSREWPVLREMDAEGDYPEVVWQYADAVAADGTVVGGKTLKVEESYKAALCS
jgi:hypothetical protein